jgi:Ni/Fe-hydrogenase subunit HybB-like protein
MARLAFATLTPPPQRLLALVAGLGALILLGLLAAFEMEERGHQITGMTNQIVWGLPHVFAIFLIVAASGALNVASIASVFGVQAYKPLAPLSGLLAIGLLFGGVAVLVLDLGRPDRLVVAIRYLNPTSIFAWNVFLYTGFAAIVAIYLCTSMARRLDRYARTAGFAAFFWRLLLTTGTGAIFGFLVARDAYHSAVMAPLFIAMSFAYGLAVFILVLAAAAVFGGPVPDAGLSRRLGRLLGVFVAVQLYFVLVLHLTNLYAANGRAFEEFVLVDGGPYPLLFWVGQLGLGGVVPLLLLFGGGSGLSRPAAAAGSVVLGGLMQVYLIVIGGQAFPMPLLPGMAVHSSFGDGEVAFYVPSLPELLLGLGGTALALAIVLLGCMVLRFLPARLGDPARGPAVAQEAPSLMATGGEATSR